MKRTLKEEKEKILSMMSEIENFDVTGHLEKMGDEEPPKRIEHPHIDRVIESVVGDLYTISDHFADSNEVEMWIHGMITKLGEIKKLVYDEGDDNIDPGEGGFGFADGRDSSGDPI